MKCGHGSGVLLTARYVPAISGWLAPAVGRKEGDGRLADPWLVRGGRWQRSAHGLASCCGSGAWCPQVLASQGRTSPSVV